MTRLARSRSPRSWSRRTTALAAAAVVAAVIVASGAPVSTAAVSPNGATFAAAVNDATTETAPATANETTTDESTDTSTTDEGTRTTTPATPEVSVRDGTLPVDAGRVFARVQRVLGTDVPPPRYVRVVEDPAELASGGLGTAPPFWRLLGVTSERALDRTERERLENGLTTSLGGIVLYPGVDPTAGTVRPLLAHEYVHYVQFVRKRRVELAAEVDVRTTDGKYVLRSVLEGAAVYATDAYVRRYVEGGRLNSDRYPRLQRKLSPGSARWYANTAYLFGHRYVADRLDSPADLAHLYARPPATSEQVIHGLAPGAEPPVALSVSTTSLDEWRAVGADRMGEAFVRAALANEVPVPNATAAAAGWGNDTLRVFRSPGRADSSYVWVLRWDDAENASEFAATARRYLTRRGDRNATAGSWRVRGRSVTLRSPSDRTTVLAFGPSSFARRLRVSADEGRVVLRLAGQDRNSSRSSGDAVRQ